MFLQQSHVCLVFGIVAKLNSDTVHAFVNVPLSTATTTTINNKRSRTGIASHSPSECNDGCDTTLSEQWPSSRRHFFASVASTAVIGSTISSFPKTAHGAAAAVQDSLDIDNFIRTGADSGGNMGVSSQAGKSRPETGVILRDGSDVSRDTQTGSVLAEILLGNIRKDPKPVLVSFSSPWPLATGPVFDIECRDSKTGDGVFVAVSKKPVPSGRNLATIPSTFFLENLFDPTNRFSFYGSPTDIKVKKDSATGNVRFLELSFSNLSQSTQSEIPRRAVVAATIPEGTENVVMLVGSSLASRWKKKGVENSIRQAVDSFRAIPAPKTSLKIRAKSRDGDFF